MTESKPTRGHLPLFALLGVVVVIWALTAISDLDQRLRDVERWREREDRRYRDRLATERKREETSE